MFFTAKVSGKSGNIWELSGREKNIDYNYWNSK